jgi:hypothetical protein
MSISASALYSAGARAHKRIKKSARMQGRRKRIATRRNNKEDSGKHAKSRAQTTRIAAPLCSLLSVLQCGALNFLPRGNLELLRREHRSLALLHTLLQRACRGENGMRTLVLVAIVGQ